MFSRFWGEEYKILFVGLWTDEFRLDSGKEAEGLGLGLAGPVKSTEING